jgi:hypothetical protein
MLKKIWVVLFLFSLIVAFTSCGGRTIPGTENGVYSRYNLHYIAGSHSNKGSFCNWTHCPSHAFVLYNTKLHVKSLSSTRLEFITDRGVAIMWEFDPGKAGMSSGEYINLITSPTPVNYEGLSNIDRKGIETGEALPGMSKQGVTIALGYPAKFRTPSLDSNQWIYWGGRFNTDTVQFDENGKVKAVK